MEGLREDPGKGTKVKALKLASSVSTFPRRSLPLLQLSLASSPWRAHSTLGSSLHPAPVPHRTTAPLTVSPRLWGLECGRRDGTGNLIDNYNQPGSRKVPSSPSRASLYICSCNHPHSLKKLVEVLFD